MYPSWQRGTGRLRGSEQVVVHRRTKDVGNIAVERSRLANAAKPLAYLQQQAPLAIEERFAGPSGVGLGVIRGRLEIDAE